nr:nucleotide-binding alpha-beta plait domain-containing protein [Tanacetum cinerariifolium]
MGSYWSKEDEALKISMSVFVANFPDSFGAKDLWNTCKQYGQVLDVDLLVNNLCTVWVGRHKLQADIPRFQREPLKRHNSLHNIDGVKRGNSRDTYNSNGVKDAANPYAHVVKGSQNSKMDSDSSLVMVLDESCLNEKDYSLCLMGKVKDFATLANLKVVVANEGFDNIKFKYMGGYWVMLEFQTEVTKLKFQENSILDFVEDNDEEENSEVGSYEEVPNREDVKNVEDLEGDSDGEIVLDTKFEEDFPNQKGKEHSVGQGNVQSKDPFNIYELLNHKRTVIDKNSNLQESLKYPLGYTPTGSKGATGEKQFDLKKIQRIMLRNLFDKSEVPKSGGSILQLIDDLVKVGGNISAYVGNSGRILCVWDPNMFKKTNSTVSDYFVMVRGDWMPNGKKLLIIVVYGPQELSEKKMLWDYLSLVMSNWKEWWLLWVTLMKFVINWKGLERCLIGMVDDFDKFIEDSWKDAPIIESNALIRMMKKFKYFKEKIRMWKKLNKEKSHKSKRSLLAELTDCDALIDKGEGENNVVNRRTVVVSLLQEVEKKNSLEAAQKEKIKWAIEGDENFEYYHGVINKKRNQVSIRGILVEGTWIDYPSLVTRDKKAVWVCGIDKSPGPDGFTFGFYRRYWKLIENDVVDAVMCFFHQG